VFVVGAVVLGVLWDLPMHYIVLAVIFAAFLLYLFGGV